MGNEKKIEEDEPMADIKQKPDRRASVEEIKQLLSDHSQPTHKDPKNWISNFWDIFPTSQDAFTEFLKGGPLSIDEAKLWDEQLKSFLNYETTKRNNPVLVHTFLLHPNILNKVCPILYSFKDSSF